MFESVTYEMILKRMLDRIPSAFDKREGSILYDALAPAAAEMQTLYISLDHVLREAYGDTADREYLVKRAAEYGLVPNEAKAAEWLGYFTPEGVEVPAGERFSQGKMNFRVLEKWENGYRLLCETAGSSGNDCSGTIVPVNYVNGLETAQLTELLIPGSNGENTEDFRKRYLIAVRKPSTSGNSYDYYNWSMECSGVGAARIFPLTDGPGTVKVVIADVDKGAASDVLVETVRNHIEELRPIGATITVVSAVEKKIHVNARIRIKDGLSLGGIQGDMAVVVADFLQQNAFDITYVSLARIGSLLLGVSGVEDFSELTLNGAAGNVMLNKEEIAVAGTVSLEVM